MDKNTLSNYGWIVIAVLVLSVMIALATPFGQYIENGVRSTTAGLFETSENALNVVLIEDSCCYVAVKSSASSLRNIKTEIEEGELKISNETPIGQINKSET